MTFIQGWHSALLKVPFELLSTNLTVTMILRPSFPAEACQDTGDGGLTPRRARIEFPGVNGDA